MTKRHTLFKSPSASIRSQFWFFEVEKESQNRSMGTILSTQVSELKMGYKVRKVSPRKSDAPALNKSANGTIP